MFAYIKGSLEVKSINYVVVENGGIGYKIYMSAKSIGTIGNIGDNIKVYTHYHVREDDISLYGFNSEEELRMFEILINVSGVGVKSALTMLSDITPSSFALAVINDDVTRLTKVPGVGKKTAQRLILELKDKLKSEDIPCEEIKVEENKDNNINNDAVVALQVLGYSKKEAETVLEKVETKDLSIEETIKEALKYLGR
ncbi:MAG: Holliday junction branch migration protein RuvA [Clostridia bacterium]|nr:Holliday junction branch migration protein RuvA [Clostridia bacterium]